MAIATKKLMIIVTKEAIKAVFTELFLLLVIYQRFYRAT
jgi:hypothetical protein